MLLVSLVIRWDNVATKLPNPRISNKKLSQFIIDILLPKVKPYFKYVFFFGFAVRGYPIPQITRLRITNANGIYTLNLNTSVSRCLGLYKRLVRSRNYIWKRIEPFKFEHLLKVKISLLSLQPIHTLNACAYMWANICLRGFKRARRLVKVFTYNMKRNI